MKTLLLAAVATLALGASAQAQRVSKITGSTLIALCTANDAKSVEACEAYIDGVADAAGTYQTLRPRDGSKGAVLPAYVCVPGEVTGGQLRTTVIESYRKRGNEQQRIASGVVLSALADAYPCR